MTHEGQEKHSSTYTFFVGSPKDRGSSIHLATEQLQDLGLISWNLGFCRYKMGNRTHPSHWVALRIKYISICKIPSTLPGP